MSTTSIRYRLPRARVVVSGTVRRTHDEDLDRGQTIETVPARLVSHAVELRHEAEGGEPLSVMVKGGWLFQYKSSFTFTEDLRLTKANAESTGSGAELLSAGATLAGAVLGVGVALAAPAATFRPAFRASHQALVNEFNTLVTRRTDARQKVNVLAGELVADPARSDVLSRQLRHLQDLIRYCDERIAALDAVYATWLSTRVTTVEETFEVVADLSTLPSTTETAGTKYGAYSPSDAPPTPPTSMQELWVRHGLTVLAVWERTTRSGAVPQVDENVVVARLAEGITLTSVEHTAGQPVVTSRTRALVADDKSEHVTYELATSLFGRRSLDLAFSTNGYLSGVGVEGSAAIAEAATAIAAIPSQVAGGIDSVNKIQSGVATARRASLDAELARVKAEVELRQQQALAAGVDLTSADAARLDRLTQLQAILETQTKIGQADPALIAMLSQGAGQDLAWYSPPPPPSPPAPQEIRIILEQQEPLAPT